LKYTNGGAYWLKEIKGFKGECQMAIINGRDTFDRYFEYGRPSSVFSIKKGGVDSLPPH
jgi:hypothetical protein